ncbi:hypothetical protein D9615_010706 [Tricholomella constricta]|uniref:Uncharacterized protein n=1 Tax=Tricholomella constricta TaxID=117010 RepID=A0A8H5LQS5_9AGAR|nr:hypothetical protein D9615_010706 [Tricholomella constricta]
MPPCMFQSKQLRLLEFEELEGTSAGQQRCGYLPKSACEHKGLLKHQSLIGKQGNISQLGGYFVLCPPCPRAAVPVQLTAPCVEIMNAGEALQFLSGPFYRAPSTVSSTVC